MGGYNIFDLFLIGVAIFLIIVVISKYNLFKGVLLLCSAAVLRYFNNILNLSETLHVIIKSASYVMAIIAFLYLVVYRIPKNFGFWDGKE
ncbi:hypothetical protein OQ664_003902 [Salmonella enterica]|nr:hypothetical protein [Salmonella enterica]